MSLLTILLAAILPPLLLLVGWSRLVGWTALPTRSVGLAVVGGIVALLLAVSLETLLPPAASDDSAWYRAFAEAGPREELFILLAACFAAWPPSSLHRLTSGVTLAVAAAAGFAGAESVAYGIHHGLGATVARAFTATPAHLLQGVVLGVGLGRVHRTASRRRATVGVLGSLVLAILAHGAYDLVLISGGFGRFGLPLFLAAEALLLGAIVVRAVRGDEGQDLRDLGRVPLLKEAQVSLPVLRMMALGSHRLAIPAGGTIATEGDDGRSLFFVSRGRLSVRKQGKEVATIPAGGLVGEVAVLAGSRRTADIVALEDCLLLELPRSALLAAIARTDDLAETLLAVAAAHGYTRLPTAEALEETALRETTAQDARLLLDEAVGRLRRTALFADLSVSALATLAQDLETVLVPAGRPLIRRGKAVSALGVLLDGALVVGVEGRELARLAPGAFFGEIGLLTGRTATADVRALGPSRVALLDWPSIRGAVGLHPSLGVRLLGAVVDHMDGLRGRGAEIQGLTATGRLDRLIDGWGLAEIDADTSIAELADALSTRAHLDVESLIALKAGMDVGGPLEWIVGPEGLRRARSTVLSIEERGLSSAGLEAALARSPDLLRALAAQAVRQ